MGIFANVSSTKQIYSSLKIPVAHREKLPVKLQSRAFLSQMWVEEDFGVLINFYIVQPARKLG